MSPLMKAVVSFFLLTSSSSVTSSSPTHNAPFPSTEPPRSGYYPSSSQRPVYIAERARDVSNDGIEEDDPYPSTASLGTARTINGAEEQPENSGFVEQIDFKNLLRDVESGSKGLELGGSVTNPLFASESKNSYSGFFDSNNNKDPFADFGGGGLATASSERKNKNANDEDASGFVDPNVQFRSLFDSTQTANNGFKPRDFLENYPSSTESARGSQTRAYPSYTYSGRKEDRSPQRYRSNYRQVETQDSDYNDSPRDDNDDYYGSPTQRNSPSSSASSRYNKQGPPSRYSSQSSQETSHRPQTAPSRSPKSAESKNNSKCKKIEKTVDYEEDYSSFTEPEPDYDPSTYRGRYKRQSRQGRQARNKNKRPMTCYVCEDEHGRYAERCSYDSNGNPKNGEYFHSSSSSFSDKGRRPSGKSDRHRRNPSLSKQIDRIEASQTTTSTLSLKSLKTNKEPEVDENEQKVIGKRQAGPGRYASEFNNGEQRDGNRNNGGGNRNFDYGLPRGYIGNNGGRLEEEYDSPQYQPPSGDDREGQGRDANRNDFGFLGDNNRDFDFGSANSGPDFNFGPPSDFGRESSPSGSRGRDSSGFNFDFSIPREYDPDVQVGGSNTNRPNSDRSPENSPNFESGYDDYVKRYFPESFGPPSSSEASSTRPSSSPTSFQPSSGPPISHSPPSYRPRPRDNSFNQYHHSNSPPSSHHRGNPDKEHTQPNYNFSPPPNFFENEEGPIGGGGGFPGGGIENTDSLNKLVENFSGKERNGCQRVQKGDMSCFVCKDARGMNKEECMYASNDPKNQKMAYHEVTEYSDIPPANILPLPQKFQQLQSQQSAAASDVSTSAVESPKPSATSGHKIPKKSITRVESMVVTRKVHHEDNSPNTSYDFDY